ncbi:MAG: hypothetical protein ACOCVM_00280 [Desulfovibrionaceae bacterium]
MKRHHRQDLVFEGEIVARASERETDQGLSTWMDVILYKTRVGKFVLASNLHSDAPGDDQIAGALAFSSADDVQEFVNTEQLMHMDVVHLLMDRAKGRGL